MRNNIPCDNGRDAQAFTNFKLCGKSDALKIRTVPHWGKVGAKDKTFARMKLAKNTSLNAI